MSYRKNEQRKKGLSYLYYAIVTGSITVIATAAGIYSAISENQAFAVTAFLSAVFYAAASLISLKTFHYDNRRRFDSDGENSVL